MFAFLLLPQMTALVMYDCSSAIAKNWTEAWFTLFDDTPPKYLDKNVLNIEYFQYKQHRPINWHRERAGVIALRRRAA